MIEKLKVRRDEEYCEGSKYLKLEIFKLNWKPRGIPTIARPLVSENGYTAPQERAVQE
jgi:hypothetical protein